MEELLPFLQRVEIWIYILLGVVALIPLQQLISAWRVWQGSVFGLEREIAQRRFSAALTVLILLVLFILLEFVIVSFVAPNYPQLASLPTPTIDLLATPTVTLPAVVGGATAESGARLTPTAPNVTEAALQEGCQPGKIEWTVPKGGDEIGETVVLKGTIQVQNLGYYKYEYARIGEDTWKTIAAGDKPKLDEEIGPWDTSQLVPGDYHLRLVVFDNQNQPFPVCVVPVRVTRP